ncbi:DDE-type integrase/transposase/recombinase, partial [Fluoribacter gormanii]
MRSTKPIAFKWRHVQGELILQCVRWYCKYGISYRDLEQMMSERGLSVDHTTLYRWVQHSRRWHLDETYIKIKDEWKYLYRAVDER